MTTYRSLRRNHDFTVLWVGETVSELGSRVSAFVFPLIGFALTGSALLASAAEALYLLGLAGTLLPAGVLADRLHRGRLMRTSSAIGALLYASLVVAAALGSLTFVHLCVAALLTGCCAGLFSPAESAAVRAVVSTEDLPTALAQNQARQHVASLVGGPLGGVLYGVSRSLPFVFDAVTYAVSWVSLGRIRTDLAAPDRPRRKALVQVREGLTYVRRHPYLRVLLAYSPLMNLMVNAVFTVAVLRLVQDGVPALHIGLVDTAAGLSGIAGAIVAPRLIERLPTGRLMVLAAWSLTPLLVPMVFWDGPAVVAAALALGLFLNPAGNAASGAYRIAITPDELQGRVQSTMQLVAMSVLPLASVLGGVLLTVLGGAAATAALAVGCALVALIPTLSRVVRSVPRPAAWTSSTPMVPAEHVASAA